MEDVPAEVVLAEILVAEIVLAKLLIVQAVLAEIVLARTLVVEAVLPAKVVTVKLLIMDSMNKTLPYSKRPRNPNWASCCSHPSSVWWYTSIS